MSATPWLVIGWVCVAAGAAMLVLAWLAAAGRALGGTPRPAARLAGLMVLAFGAFCVVSGLLLQDNASTESDALRTGGLAALVVVALYVVWLYEHRPSAPDHTVGEHRLAEAQRDLDRQRIDHDRGRAADDRFAKALELLGHDADQVRVGALHALAGIARSDPRYGQTTVDILCAYLRRPFDHASYQDRRATQANADRNDDAWHDVDADRERQVRLTAQRLIVDLLPSTSEVDGPDYNLDLTGAALEYFDLSHKRVGTFTARSAHFYEAVSFEGTWFHGPIWLTWAHMWGEAFRANDMVCHGIAWWSNFTASGPVDFDRTDFRGETKFAYATFADRVSFQGCHFATSADFQNTEFLGELSFTNTDGLIGRTAGMRVSLQHDVRLPLGWVVDPRDSREPGLGLVRA
ncbi:MAG TPA: pentapeptide repeat-containing protein [Pseudonocardiaceae bacterium]|nr:pentapeptide repeat-containing protein [Pseudonocardiaceae bacterium]